MVSFQAKVTNCQAKGFFRSCRLPIGQKSDNMGLTKDFVAAHTSRFKMKHSKTLHPQRKIVNDLSLFIATGLINCVGIISTDISLTQWSIQNNWTVFNSTSAFFIVVSGVKFVSAFGNCNVIQIRRLLFFFSYWDFLWADWSNGEWDWAYAQSLWSSIANEWMLIVLVRRKLYDQISRLRTPGRGVRRWSHPCYLVTITENLSFDVLHCYYST